MTAQAPSTAGTRSLSESPETVPSEGTPQTHGALSLPRATRRPSPTSLLHPRRVLIACSEPLVAESLERVIRHHAADLSPTGVEVRRAGDGIACLQLLEMARPDLLVVQPRLERMSGVEVVETWRRAHPGESLPIVALSSLYGSDVPEGLSARATICLPWQHSELVERLQGALGVG